MDELIGVGTIVDFELPVEEPRREFINLQCRSPIPETLELWKEYLGSAVHLAEERLKNEFGSTRQIIIIRVKHGLVRIGDFRIEVNDFDGLMRQATSWAVLDEPWNIQKWYSPPGNYLYELMLEYKYLEPGDQLGYYDHKDHIPEPSDSPGNIFGDSIIGMPDMHAQMYELSTHRMKASDPTRMTMRLIAKDRLRTPIVHTR